MRGKLLILLIMVIVLFLSSGCRNVTIIDDTVVTIVGQVKLSQLPDGPWDGIAVVFSGVEVLEPVYTNASGNYEVVIAPAWYDIEISYSGYEGMSEQINASQGGVTLDMGIITLNTDTAPDWDGL